MFIHVIFSEQILLTLYWLLDLCRATFDINPQQLQMVADSLKMNECRKLSESLHQQEFKMDHDPTGNLEPKDVSCLRLLEHWNTHEGKDETFHQLALRLRQLGRKDIADRLSESVSDEKVHEVRETFLDDPFKSRIHTNSPLLQESPHVETQLPTQIIDDQWTIYEIGQAVVISAITVVFSFLAILLLFRVFLPDSFARMRATWYVSFLGKRPSKEELFLIM
ncbi:uncharacterized protein LOC129230477 [Uloborus diversus]|uniref:uncharacterized protein LOC129230477 n=1 Tax=Uloborus diversus TaxID=327109 RepID=UPI00240A69E1|nr:uncharacterized protein LOC129230477 [Uloborus diversus]